MIWWKMFYPYTTPVSCYGEERVRVNDMKVLILYYSMYGHTFVMAQAIAEGAASVDGIEVKIAQAPELVPDSIIQSVPDMKAAKELQKDIPVAKIDDLLDADGIIFGSPTRFGNMCSQLRNFLDQTGPIWAKGALVGKSAGFFTTTGGIHGGQETTLVSMMFTALHHGMIIVGIPYSIQEMITTTRGGTPYGASMVSGPQGELMATEGDLTIARFLGQRVAEVTKKLRAR